MHSISTFRLGPHHPSKRPDSNLISAHFAYPHTFSLLRYKLTAEVTMHLAVVCYCSDKAAHLPLFAPGYHMLYGVIYMGRFSSLELGFLLPRQG